MLRVNQEPACDSFRMLRPERLGSAILNLCLSKPVSVELAGREEKATKEERL